MNKSFIVAALLSSVATLSLADEAVQPAAQARSADAPRRADVTLVAVRTNEGSASAPLAHHARAATPAHQGMPDSMRPEADPDKTDRH